MGLYYLQSRYYNPSVGRFLNADALISTGQGVLGNNMFVYCRNNPTNYLDSSGYYDEMYSSASKRAFVTVIFWGMAGAGGAILLAPVIIDVVNEISADIADTTSQAVDGLITAIEHECQRLQQKIESNCQYWEAYLDKGKVYIGRGITFLEACLRVSCGFSVMCANQDAARWIVVVNRYWFAVGPETHGDEGYYWHYHPHRNTHTHIWFY